MARKILLLGDDPTVLRQAAEALASQGWDIATDDSPEAALERIQAGEADLAVIDTDLGGGRGISAADELQRRMGAFPVVLLVADERRDRMKASGSRDAATAGKPIRADELREAVTRVLGPGPVALTPGPVPGASAPQGGEIASRPVHALLGDLARRSATGALELASASHRIRIYFQGGRVVAAADEATPPPHPAEPGRHTAALVEAACGLSRGTWRFVAGAAAPAEVPKVHLHPLALAAAGVRRAYPIATIRGWLERHRSERIVAHPELAAQLTAAGIATQLPAALAQNHSVAALLRSLGDVDLALVFTLVGFSLVRFGAAAPARESGATPLSPAERRAIEAERLRIEGSNHYEILGVAPTADPAEIRRAYFAAAKRWHSDAFAGRDLGDLAPVVERIFAAVSEAHQVLGDAARRAEYDVFLERKAKGLPTDVSAVLRAEGMFLEAQKLFRAQRYADAEALLRQAVELNPAEAEFWAYLGASGYRARGKSAVAEAREAFARARSLIPESIVTEYLEAQLEIGEGELDAAERRLRKILLVKPDHTEAARDLRILHERKERESATGRGFLRPLWKRK